VTKDEAGFCLIGWRGGLGGGGALLAVGDGMGRDLENWVSWLEGAAALPLESG
jgi:hypothetical protein